jgi:gallate decarboxylase subunit D
MKKRGWFMVKSLPKITAKSSGPDYNIRAEALWIGPDLLVYIWGGEAPHIGAVAMAQPRPSLADPERTSATASVFAYVGHKEDDLAKWAAETLSAALEAKVVVTAGIHWDGMDQTGIKTVLANSEQLVHKLIDLLKA